MQIHLEQKPVESLECDALVVLTFRGQAERPVQRLARRGLRFGRSRRQDFRDDAGASARRVSKPSGCCWPAPDRRRNSLRPSCGASRGGAAPSEIADRCARSRYCWMRFVRHAGARARRRWKARCSATTNRTATRATRKTSRLWITSPSRFRAAARSWMQARGARPHHRGSPEPGARAGQRTGQPADAHIAGRGCPANGRRERARVRSAGPGPHEAARHGIAAGRRHGKRGTAGADRAALPAGEGRAAPRTWGWSAKASPSTPAASPSSPPTAWRR